MPHALYTAEGAEVCLIVKDHKGEGHKGGKEVGEAGGAGASIAKVWSIESPMEHSVKRSARNEPAESLLTLMPSVTDPDDVASCCRFNPVCLMSENSGSSVIAPVSAQPCGQPYSARRNVLGAGQTFLCCTGNPTCRPCSALSHDSATWQVVGVSKLRTKYESHEAKRILAGAYDLFVADERVIPSLPKLLGANSLCLQACGLRQTCACDAQLMHGTGYSMKANIGVVGASKGPRSARQASSDWLAQRINPRCSTDCVMML